MKTIVIGAGASGLMAAGWAAKNGEDVTILEKTSSCGKKIFLLVEALRIITGALDISAVPAHLPRHRKSLECAH